MEEQLTDKELSKLYLKFVKNRYFYRAVSREYLPKIKIHGLTPHESPFEHFKKELRQFLNIIKFLDKKGYKIIYKWPHETPPLSKLIRVLRKDLRKNYLDLSPDGRHHKYYLQRKGGSLVTTILYLLKLIEKKKYPLTPKQVVILNKVGNWCKKRSKYGMATLLIPRSSANLRKAHFQHFGGKYWASPFGNFENFKKVISNEGWEKYKERLQKNKNYYIRLINTVPAKEIIFLN
jgi:hypothetical protein